MTDVDRHKAIRATRVLLAKVRGHLLAADINHAVSDLRYFVMPMLAGAVEDRDAGMAGQLMITAQFGMEGIGGDVFIDWSRFEEAERYLEQDDAIAALERMGWVVVPIQDHRRYIIKSWMEIRDGTPFFNQSSEVVHMGRDAELTKENR